MSEEIEVKMYRSSNDYKITLAATFENAICGSMPSAIMKLVAEKIAERYVDEHYAEIVARLDQQAIANLAVADSGKKIAEEIRTRPVVIQEPGNTTFNIKRSIF